MIWRKLDTIPKDRPVMLAVWRGASDWPADRIKEPHWTYYGLFKWQEAPEHDRDVVCVSLDREHWLRSGITASGYDVLSPYRWADIPALPEQPFE